ncbi:alpha/beta hydrolase, partial [Patescibacteria group bacterium]|nr:alpha/beta hydrolase [Patescibacteria group bacterium]
ENFTVYTLDLPGFGGSSVPKTPFTISDYSDVVSGFMEKMKIKKTILVGHSFGGRIAIKLAATKPQLIKKLVLIDSAGFASKKRQSMKFLAKLVKPLFTPAWIQGIRTRIYTKIGAEDYLATPALQKTFMNIIKEDLSDDISHIHVPTLLLWGENDMETPVLYGRRMHEKIHNSQLVVLPDAGHFSFLDKPGEFYQAFIRFIK